MLVANFLVKLINLVTNIVVGLLALRFLLKFLGASSTAPFVVWIYNTTQPILAPFLGMFTSPIVEQRLIVELSTVFAIVVYTFIGYILSDIVNFLSFRASEREKKFSK